MPCFTIPIHEHGDPSRTHLPYPHAGGAPNPNEAQLVRPGQRVDLQALAQAGAEGGRRKTRRFLFNPASRELAFGVAFGHSGRDQSHAEALEYALGDDAPATGTGMAQRYDQFTVHGHIQSYEDDPLAVVIDRVIGAARTPQGYRTEARYAEELDQLAEFVSRLAAAGAPATTPLLANQLAGGRWTTLGKAFPELFAKKKRAA